MHRLTVGQHYDAEPAPAGFTDPGPAANPPVHLYSFELGMSDYSGNPSFANHSAIASSPDEFEILRGFHSLRRTTF
jgi:hypothetical protein